MGVAFWTAIYHLERNLSCIILNSFCIMKKDRVVHNLTSRKVMTTAIVMRKL
jgi:hypothetical protein